MLQLKLSGQYRYILCSFHWFIWKIVYFFLSQVTGKKKNSCQVTVCSLVFVSSQQRFGMTIPYGPTLPYLHNKEFWILFKKYGYCVYIGLKKKNKLFIYDCAGSSLLHGLSLSCGEWGPLSSCGARPYHCGGFSCCWAKAFKHVGFSSCSTWAQ